jgi:hypothetical protein
VDSADTNLQNNIFKYAWNTTCLVPKWARITTPTTEDRRETTPDRPRIDIGVRVKYDYPMSDIDTSKLLPLDVTVSSK